ncbi:MAG: hypothetical protein HQ494_15675 [Rhodospirillales bacterium]|nr:hypothetical protein [Rhodospirillales bacterium]
MRCKVAASPMVKAFAQCLLFSFVFLSGSPGFAQTGQAQPLQNPAPKGQVKTYLHPIRKFTAAIPVGAELSERGESVQVSIRSRRGYIINLQTGDANPAFSLAQMIAKLETKYLGEGKPWKQKLGGRTSKLASLNAIEALYEGAGTRVKAVVARGAKTDFVIIFFAPVESFEKLEYEFNWFLSNFSPNPADLPAAERAAVLAPIQAAIAPKRFDRAEYGYTIEYPGNWDASRPSENTASFSGKTGTPAYQVVVSIQNVRPATAKTPGEATDQALKDLKASLSREAKGFKIVEEKPLTYRNGNLSLSGRQILVTYTYSGERYRKLTLILPRPTGTVAHIWSYTAPDSRFVEFRPYADAMLKSWTIKPGGG